MLSSPDRLGCVFVGWYRTSDFSGSRVEEIASASHGDVVLWAKWDLKVKKLIEITAKDIPVLSLEKLEKGANLLLLSGDITDEDLIAVGTFIRELTYGYTVHLDLSNVKGIIFEDIENWCVKGRYNGKVLAENINLADPENNVTLLTETYCYELFEKKIQ